MNRTALLVIDVQNDYFAGGALPLWDAEATLDRLVQAMERARAAGMPVVLVQHLAADGAAFRAGTPGAELHPRIRAAAPEAPVVAKAFADSFHQTALEATLAGLGVSRLLVAGMMTQNCVTHTAISRAAEKYEVIILPDCCTTVSELVHTVALRAVSTRLELQPSSSAF
jgi:nicotinamidase-related amidase